MRELSEAEADELAILAGAVGQLGVIKESLARELEYVTEQLERVTVTITGKTPQEIMNQAAKK